MSLPALLLVLISQTSGALKAAGPNPARAAVATRVKQTMAREAALMNGPACSTDCSAAVVDAGFLRVRVKQELLYQALVHDISADLLIGDTDQATSRANAQTFEAAETIWLTYRDKLCQASYNQKLKDGGTTGNTPPGCQLQLTDKHMNDLTSLYDGLLTYGRGSLDEFFDSAKHAH